jgi:transcription initiation factor IIE alpha subunit
MRHMTVQTRENQLLQVLRANGRRSDEAISTSTGWSLRTVQRAIWRLRKTDTIKVSRTRYQLGGNWVNQRHIEVQP